MKLCGRRMLVVALTVAALLGGLLAPNAVASIPAASGGQSLTAAMVNDTWTTLGPPPAVVSNLFEANYMNAIYGQLFERNSNGSIMGDLATGYKFSTSPPALTISIRPGVKFSNGDAFTAANVASFFQAALSPANACTCLANYQSVESVTSSGNKVVMHLSRQDATLVQSFPSNQMNWVADMAAYKSMGANKYGLSPIGAGPFKVVSDTPGSQLVLTKNPKYWQSGEPYLSKLTFENLSDDQTALAALESHSVQAVIGMTSPSVLESAKQEGLKLWSLPGVVAYQVLFNLKNPKSPMQNLKAREAVAYATNPLQTLAASSAGFGTVTQSGGGPSSLFFEKTVPGTMINNQAKAKALVKQLGGVSFEMYYPNNQQLFINAAQALYNEWRAVGINVTLDEVTPVVSGQLNKSGDWEAQLTTTGGVDPRVGSTGFLQRYGSKGSLTCCSDTKLDSMIAAADRTLNSKADGDQVAAIFKYINSKVYAIDLFSASTVIVSAPGVSGLDAGPNNSSGKQLVFWQTVR